MLPAICRGVLSGVVLVLIAVVGQAADQQPPLHVRIDRLIAARPGFDQQAAPLASDSEFLRRVYLDLTGTIPTVAEVRAFLDNPSPTRRTEVIDRLLSSPEYARHMQNVFDVLWMERRPEKYVKRAEWQEYLRSSFQANKPWDELVREILSADGAEPKLRPAARFVLDREAEPNQLTRDISRLFLGMNLHCAQCHDHPLVDDYLQEHYGGIFAFLNRTFLFKVKNETMLAEKAEGEATIQSVFDPKKVTRTMQPRLPGRPALAEPKFDKGQEYAVAPAKDVRPVPKFSRRAQLAQQITDSDNVLFRRNAVNRLWAHMMGRGLVEPLDMHHSSNPPSHPELLTLLADEFLAMKFDVRAFLRELALSQTYQRASEPPAGVSDPPVFGVASLKPLPPESFALAVMQATGFIDAERQALADKLTEPALYARLAGGINAFAATFGGPAGQPEGKQLEVTIDQTLFLLNGDLVRGWLTPRAGNLADRLQKLADPAALADELYLSVLTRPPDEAERKEVIAYLSDRSPDRLAAIQELIWALLASAEFRFNH